MFEKVPQYPSNLKPPKMQKRLRYMRGPELLHNTLQLKQYGIVVSTDTCFILITGYKPHTRESI